MKGRLVIAFHSILHSCGWRYDLPVVEGGATASCHLGVAKFNYVRCVRMALAPAS